MPKIKKGAVRKILFSQETPLYFERSPYAVMTEKFGLKIDFFKFFRIQGLEADKFMQNGLNILDYTAVIMTSKNAIDHFFRIVKALKISLPASLHYFCVNEAMAAYLQKHMVYCKKRQIFFPPDGDLENLANLAAANSKHKFLIPCSLDVSMHTLIDLLDEKKVDYAKAEVFKIRLRNAAKAVNIYDYDMIVFFSPYGIQSLQKYFPDYKQDNTVIAAFGTQVAKAAEEAGLQVLVKAPTKENPSIFTAIDHYLEKRNGVRKSFLYKY